MCDLRLRDDGCFHVDLGSVFVSNPSEDVAVSAATSALLTPRLLAGDVLPADHLKFASFEDCWVNSGHALRCLFSLCFDNTLNLSLNQQTNISGQLSKTLEEAELWRQLSYTPTLLYRSHAVKCNEHLCHRFELLLCPLTSLQGAENDAANIRAPDLIPTLCLSSVQVDLHFTCFKTGADRPAARGTLNPPVRIALRVNAKGVEPFLDLADVAIRETIVSRSLRTCSGFKIEPKTDRLGLSQLSPISFIPNYATRIVSRWPLIPFICKSLSSVTSHAVSIGGSLFREGFFHCAWTECRCHEDESHLVSSKREILSAHLWLTMTKGLLDVGPSRRLEALKVSIGSVEERHGRSPPEFQHEPYELASKLPAHTPWKDVGTFDCKPGQQLDHLLMLEIEETVIEPEEENIEEILFDLYDAHRGQPSSKFDACQHHTFRTNNDTGDEPSEQMDEEKLLTHSQLDGMNLNDETTFHSSCEDNVVVLDIPTEVPFHLRSVEELNKSISAGATKKPVSNGNSQSLAVTSVIGGPSMLTEGDIRLLPHTARLGHLTSARSIILTPSHGPAESDILLEGLSETLSVFSFKDANSNCERSHRSSMNKGLTKNSLLDELDMATSSSQQHDSLSALLGDDHLMWRMWQRRTSVDPVSEDMMTLHDLFARDPDMKLLGSSQRNSRRPSQSAEFEEMLDTDYSTIGSNSPITPQSTFIDPFPYPSKSQNRRAEKANSSTSTRPSLSRRLSRGSSLIKRLSLSSRSSSSTSSTSDIDMQRVEELLNDKRRPMEIKRRKKLEDYHQMDLDVEGEEMILS